MANDFNRGAAAQARAHYAFLRKQGEATAELGRRIIHLIDQYGGIVDVVVDELSQQELENVFGVFSPLSISCLEQSERMVLFSYLTALFVRKGQNTKQQNDYYFAVKKYLNIEKASDSIAFDSVSNLDISRTELKAFLECVCEFLFLKRGSRDFLIEFKEELDCFGVSERVLDEIVTPIEKMYSFFGVQGIIEHYSVECSNESENENEKEPVHIPFFEKPFAIIYNGKEKHHLAYAEMVKSTIEERLEALGIEKPIICIENEKKMESTKTSLEETRHLIYIGEPKQAKGLYEIMKWEFNKFGIRFGTSGEKSIIDVDKVKKKDYQAFSEYVKSNESRWESSLSKTMGELKQNFLRECYGESNDGVDVAVNVLATLVAWPLLAFGSVLDGINRVDLKDELKKLQFFVAIDEFISSKINVEKE